MDKSYEILASQSRETDMNKRLIDIESRGKVGFNTGCLKSHEEAEKYARKHYSIAVERDVFVAGWNMAFWAQ